MDGEGKEKRPFIGPHGGYKKLRSYRAAEKMYDATVIFCKRFIDPYNRTYGQMIQAARSGKQNIAEGSMMAGTSKALELKLTGVALSSQEELIKDYEDYLNDNHLRIWDKDSKEGLAGRQLCEADQAGRAEESKFLNYVRTRSAETAANLILCMTQQASYLTGRQIKRLEKDFVKNGGVKEQMTKARRAERKRTGDG
jgi:four helix bundle suffix protein